MQIIYLVLAIGGFYAYVSTGFPHVPGPYVAWYHKYTGTALMIACYYSYYKACTVNPGYITCSTHKTALGRFKYDMMLFTP